MYYITLYQVILLVKTSTLDYLIPSQHSTTSLLAIV